MGETVVAGGTDLHVGPENLNFNFTAVGSRGGGAGQAVSALGASVAAWGVGCSS